MTNHGHAHGEWIAITATGRRRGHHTRIRTWDSSNYNNREYHYQGGNNDSLLSSRGHRQGMKTNPSLLSITKTESKKSPPSSSSSSLSSSASASVISASITPLVLEQNEFLCDSIEHQLMNELIQTATRNVATSIHSRREDWSPTATTGSRIGTGFGGEPKGDWDIFVEKKTTTTTRTASSFAYSPSSSASMSTVTTPTGVRSHITMTTRSTPNIDAPRSTEEDDRYHSSHRHPHHDSSHHDHPHHDSSHHHAHHHHHPRHYCHSRNISDLTMETYEMKTINKKRQHPHLSSSSPSQRVVEVDDESLRRQVRKKEKHMCLKQQSTFAYASLNTFDVCVLTSPP